MNKYFENYGGARVKKPVLIKPNDKKPKNEREKFLKSSLNFKINWNNVNKICNDVEHFKFVPSDEHKQNADTSSSIFILGMEEVQFILYKALCEINNADTAQKCNFIYFLLCRSMYKNTKSLFVDDANLIENILLHIYGIQPSRDICGLFSYQFYNYVKINALNIPISQKIAINNEFNSIEKFGLSIKNLSFYFNKHLYKLMKSFNKTSLIIEQGAFSNDGTTMAFNNYGFKFDLYLPYSTEIQVNAFDGCACPIENIIYSCVLTGEGVQQYETKIIDVNKSPEFCKNYMLTFIDI